ncbi:MAG TPA: SEC-C metal-binding domain-containing protein [Gemmatimonadales bacterium]|nr:SEC-C metal-binding domain-containing protein [Gemmatimonadales bacterium]
MPPPITAAVTNLEAVWQSTATLPTNSTAFERTSKRRQGYPSETRVKRGIRVVHGDKELLEKLGRNDLCPCGSGRRFQALLPSQR